MPSIETYKGLQRVSPSPTGAAGEMINNNLTTIADRLTVLETPGGGDGFPGGGGSSTLLQATGIDGATIPVSQTPLFTPLLIEANSLADGDIIRISSVFSVTNYTGVPQSPAIEFWINGAAAPFSYLPTLQDGNTFTVSVNQIWIVTDAASPASTAVTMSATALVTDGNTNQTIIQTSSGSVNSALDMYVQFMDFNGADDSNLYIRVYHYTVEKLSVS